MRESEMHVHGECVLSAMSFFWNNLVFWVFFAKIYNYGFIALIYFCFVFC